MILMPVDHPRGAADPEIIAAIPSVVWTLTLPNPTGHGESQRTNKQAVFLRAEGRGRDGGTQVGTNPPPSLQ